jgi:hypothetical protein
MATGEVLNDSPEDAYAGAAKIEVEMLLISSTVYSLKGPAPFWMHSRPRCWIARSQRVPATSMPVLVTRSRQLWPTLEPLSGCMTPPASLENSRTAG